MATAGFQCGVYPIYVDRMLLHKHGGYRLECNAEEDILSVADAALNTAGVIGFRFNTSAVIEEYGILFRTFLLQAFKSVAVFECFGSIDTEHGRGKRSV